MSAESNQDRIPGAIDLESAGDPRLADFAGLSKRPRGRSRDDSSFVVEGAFLVERLLASDFEVRCVVVEQGRDVVRLGPVPASTPIYRLSSPAIRQLVGFDFHRGYLASAVRRRPLSLDDYSPDAVSLALVQISDMENLGSMLRSAAAFGIRQVLVDHQSVDVYSRRALRVSMGAALGMRVVSIADPVRDLKTLSDRGVVSVAATLADDSVPIETFSHDHDGVPLLIVVGNEADGLPKEVQDAATRRVRIGMSSSGNDRLVDSLNVSVAAAIFMYELTRDGNLESRRRNEG